ELLHRPLHEALDRGSIIDVRRYDERPTTFSFDGFGDPNERLLVARSEHDRCSPIGEHLCGGRTDPATRPRDDRDLAGERTTVPIPSLRSFSVPLLSPPLSSPAPTCHRTMANPCLRAASSLVRSISAPGPMNGTNDASRGFAAIILRSNDSTSSGSRTSSGRACTSRPRRRTRIGSPSWRLSFHLPPPGVSKTPPSST